MTAAAAPRTSAPRAGGATAPRPGSGGRRPGLRVVTERDLLRQSRRRRARILLGLSACVVAGALLVVAVANSLVVSQQVRLDAMRSQLTTALAQNQDLQLQRAVLESPARILSIAEHRLGMVTPAKITYLMPVSASATVPLPAAPASATRTGGSPGQKQVAGPTGKSRPATSVPVSGNTPRH